MNLPKSVESGSTKKKSLIDSIGSFFTSVRTAIALLFLLAAVSIIGTVIPQDSALDQIRQSAGSFSYRLVAILDLHKVYRSWWFVLLLVLLSLNLVGCLIRRLRVIPQEWAGGSEKNSFSFGLSVSRPLKEVRDTVVLVINRILRISPQISEKGDRITIVWSKHRIYLLGFPLIHIAIIIILLGAVIGLAYGFKGTIQIKEGTSGNRFTLIPSGQVASLSFDIALEGFTLVRYPTGEPKEFRSDVRILKNATEEAKGAIRVNQPLTFEGISLYQSDYRLLGIKEVKLGVSDHGETTDLVLQPHSTVMVPGTEYTIGLISLDPGATKRGAGVEISVEKSGEQPRTIKLFRKDSAPVTLGSIEIRFLDYQPLYATGLQIGYDPGAQVVWVGCALLILGLFISLFTNLRRIHIDITGEAGRTEIGISGRSRKMRREFRETVEMKVRQALQDN